MEGRTKIASPKGMLPIVGCCPTFEIGDEHEGGVKGVIIGVNFRTSMKVWIIEIVRRRDEMWGNAGTQAPKEQIVFRGEVCDDNGKSVGIKVHGWLNGRGGFGEAILTEPEGQDLVHIVHNR